MNREQEVFQNEKEHLAVISEKLGIALKKAEQSVQNLEQEYRDTKKYMSEYRGEIDPHEMFQTELLLKQTDRTGVFVVERRDKIRRMKDSPYFARIDFRERGIEKAEVFYIGSSSFNYENELLIFDWRTPVAGMFYDFETGPSDYMAPSGLIEGVLTRKRQFKIKDGVLEYVLESSMSIQDDVLQKELSQTSDEKMKSIIATIQKEQNQIIRNEKADTLIIQGVAGSGKTSIALHRIAFLLYRFKNSLSSKNVTILSPNRVFGDYISNVIPELGEEPVYGLSFEELAEIQLEGIISFQSPRDSLEDQDEAWMKRARFKSTLAFVSVMDQYISSLPERIFLPEDYIYGRFTADTDWIRKRFLAYSGYPLKKRLSMTAEDIHEKFCTENIMEDEVPKARAIEKKLSGMLKIKNSLALYQDFYKSMNIRHMFWMPEKKVLEWEDVYPFLYLHMVFAGVKESRVTKHLVVDEMQDYTPIQYAVLNLLFPCQKTILGDFGQYINPNHQHSLEDIRQLYPCSEFVRLNKSYRSTCEIMNFAKQIQNTPELEAVKRRGELPVVIHCARRQEVLRKIKELIRKFQAGEMVSMGIILKTNSRAKALHSLLSQEYDLHLISQDSARFQNGISITSVQMAKGLEFDEVIIPEAGNEHYKTDYDRNLLYIACTRAMHRLTLLYTDKLSGLICEKADTFCHLNN